MAPAERLSEGVVVQVDVTARLLGAPILQLDGDVVLAPARLDGVGSGPPEPSTPALLPVTRPGSITRMGSALGRAEWLYAQSVGVLRRADNGAGRTAAATDDGAD
jgi:hypothetical protein